MTLTQRSDQDWMRAAIALSLRGRPSSNPNPSVGCIIVKQGRVLGRGWTSTGGRPHAEANALAQAGATAAGADIYVTLEPCAHVSDRGPACAALLAAAKPARVIVALPDPDPRTHHQGLSMLQAAGITTISNVCADEARQALAGFLCRQTLGRPAVTLKLATSLDGQIAMADGTSQWITGPESRAHSHVERAHHDAILVGGATLREDAPQLTVRLPGLESRAPKRIVLSGNAPPPGWLNITEPQAIHRLAGIDWLMIEGGAQTAAAFLQEDLVDRLLLYRAPILIGQGRTALGDIGLSTLDTAHGRWRLCDARPLGKDRMESYERVR